MMLLKIKKITSGFYASIKALDENLAFILIAGVSKFAKVSVFSGMNNLRDISMEWPYTGMKAL